MPNKETKKESGSKVEYTRSREGYRKKATRKAAGKNLGEEISGVNIKEFDAAYARWLRKRGFEPDSWGSGARGIYFGARNEKHDLDQ